MVNKDEITCADLGWHGGLSGGLRVGGLLFHLKASGDNINGGEYFLLDRICNLGLLMCSF